MAKIVPLVEELGAGPARFSQIGGTGVESEKDHAQDASVVSGQRVESLRRVVDAGLGTWQEEIAGFGGGIESSSDRIVVDRCDDESRCGVAQPAHSVPHRSGSQSGTLRWPDAPRDDVQRAAAYRMNELSGVVATQELPQTRLVGEPELLGEVLSSPVAVDTADGSFHAPGEAHGQSRDVYGQLPSREEGRQEPRRVFRGDLVDQAFRQPIDGTRSLNCCVGYHVSMMMSSSWIKGASEGCFGNPDGSMLPCPTSMMW